MRRGGGAWRRQCGEGLRVFLNTKGHKELLSGMYRSTKASGWRAARGGDHRRRCACVTVCVMRVRTSGVNGGCNGGRARCPHRAARVMRRANGGAIMISRRVRGPAAHRAADRAAACKTLSVCYLPSRPMPCRQSARAVRTQRGTGEGAHHGARTVRTQRDRTTGRDVWPPGLLARPRPRGGRLFFPAHFCMIGQVVSGALRTKPTYTNTYPYPFS